MKTGMLWIEKNIEIDLIAKVINAADFYERHYGQKPNLCFVHPSAMTFTPPRSDRLLEIRASSHILRHHLWLGVDEAATGHHKAMTSHDLSPPQLPLPLHVSDCD
jgi:hypothetical protein